MTPRLGSSFLIIMAMASSIAGLAAPALATFGNPILARGEVLLGVTTRQFTRDVYDVEADALSNPDDTFGYVGLESRLGLYQDRLDFGLEVGRAHNQQDRFPDRDYLTWELGFTLRGLIYRQPEGRMDVTGGAHFRETVAFDRAATLTHKLQRNYAAFMLVGRLTNIHGRPLRLYGGPLYSRHEIDEYGTSFQVGEGPGEGETRKNFEFLGGASLRILPEIEAGAEIEYRESLSFGLSAGVLF
jgi:hypothetical protein